MTQRYIFSITYNGEEPMVEQMGEETPVSLAGAVRLYRQIESYHSQAAVTCECMDSDAGTFKDITELVRDLIQQDEADEIDELLLTARHERQESRRDIFV